MKRHIKATLITAGILAVLVGLSILAATYPKYLIDGIIYLVLGIGVGFIYQVALTIIDNWNEYKNN